MRQIYGRECRLTLLKNGISTAIPYKLETLRCDEISYSLDSTVGKQKRMITRTCGSRITGCFVTRLDETCAPALFDLLSNPEEPCTLLANRITDRTAYRNVTVLGFELRGQLDGALYLRIDIAETPDSTAEESHEDGMDTVWTQKPTWHLHEGEWFLADIRLPLIYLFSFTGDYAACRNYTLSIHTPYTIDSPSVSDDSLYQLQYRGHNPLRLQFETLNPMTDMFDTDNGGALLITRKYRIENHISVQTRTPAACEEWEL